MNNRNKFGLKKALWVGYGIFALLIGIAVTGFIANYAWLLFHALILGWGDSTPEWYIGIQDWVIYGIFAASAALWVAAGYYRHAKSRNKPET